MGGYGFRKGGRANLGVAMTTCLPWSILFDHNAFVCYRLRRRCHFEDWRLRSIKLRRLWPGASCLDAPLPLPPTRATPSLSLFPQMYIRESP